MKSIDEIRKLINTYPNNLNSYMLDKGDIQLIFTLLLDHIEQLEKDVRELKGKCNNSKEDVTEKEQKKCYVDHPKLDSYMYFSNDTGYLHFNFCPECGQDLRKEGE